MLRITRTNINGHTILKLEGKLLAAWVPEVLNEVGQPDGHLHRTQFDLSKLSFADSAGQALLHDLLSRGASVMACSSYLSELLHVEKP